MNQVQFAWALLIASVIGWPLSALTFAKEEPQTVLALSWIAIIIAAINTLITAKIRNDQD